MCPFRLRPTQSWRLPRPLGWTRLFEKCRQFTKAREIQAAGLYPYFKPISESEDTVVVIDGLYGRDGWAGRWEEEVDVLPLAASQSMASTPYLLEACGFRIEAVQRMTAVNALPTTRTPRYVVVARKTAR